MNNKIKIGDLVTVKGKPFTPGKVIDTFNRHWVFRTDNMAIVGWKIKYKRLTFLSTKKILISELKLYNAPKLSILKAIKNLFK